MPPKTDTDMEDMMDTNHRNSVNNNAQYLNLAKLVSSMSNLQIY